MMSERNHTKRSHSVWFHVHEISRGGDNIETNADWLKGAMCGDEEWGTAAEWYGGLS